MVAILTGRNYRFESYSTISAIFLLATALTVSPTAAAAADSGTRPNVILMMADDQGWGDAGYQGHPHLKTPHLDAMAAAGLRLDRFYSAAPVCSPTRGSSLTGRHPYRYGILYANVGHLPAEEITLAELLRDADYATGHFGKWHLGTLTKTEKDANRGGPSGARHFSPPWQNGFDVCFSTESKVPTWDPLWRPAGARGGTWWDPADDLSAASPYGTAYWNEEGEKVTGNLRGDDSRAIMDRAIPFIRSAVQADRPFFAVIWFHAPHLPVVSGDEFTGRYVKHDKYRQHYWGCITAMDEQIGRLRAELRDLGADRDTMLWYCSDNGPEGNASAPGSAKLLRGRKRSLFEGGVRVPSILEWPAKITAGRATGEPAVTSDYLPTVLDALQIDFPHERPIDGVSLLPLIDGKSWERPAPIGFESRGQVSWVDNRYKLIAAPGKRKGGRASDRFMLFDLLVDPAEADDLAARHPEIVAGMREQLARWRASCTASREGADYAAGL